MVVIEVRVETAFTKPFRAPFKGLLILFLLFTSMLDRQHRRFREDADPGQDRKFILSTILSFLKNLAPTFHVDPVRDEIQSLTKGIRLFFLSILFSCRLIFNVPSWASCLWQ